MQRPRRFPALRPPEQHVVVVALGCGPAAPDGEDVSGTAMVEEESTGAPSPGSDASTSSGDASTSSGGASLSSSDETVYDCEIMSPQFASPPSSSLDGMRIVPNDPGVSIEIPGDWLASHEEGRNNLHLTRDELEQVREGAGEWDTEYAFVLAALLDFDDCSAHIGSEGWGLEAVSFGDLQLRIYRVGETPAE